MAINYNTMVPGSLQRMVQDKIDLVVKQASLVFDHQFDPITDVSYDVRGRTAGQAWYCTRRIGLNRVIFLENSEAFLARTVPHEVMHILAYDLHGTKAKGHGVIWKRMMAMLGFDNSRCHSYNTSNAQVKKKKKFKYSCTCGQTYVVGPVCHRKILDKTRAYWCSTCGTHLDVLPWEAMGNVTFEQAFAGVQAPPKETTQRQAAQNASKRSKGKGETKIARAAQIYREGMTNGQDRSFIIRRFETELSMSRAGANTYYANCKKAYEK